MNTIQAAAAALLAAAFVYIPHAADARVSATFKTRLTSAQARLGLDLLQKLAAPPPRRPIVAISPAGIAGAAGALDVGASPQMRTALHGVLGFEPSSNSDEDMGLLRTNVARLDAAQSSGGPLRTSRSIAFDRALALRADVPATMKKTGIGRDIVDFGQPSAVEMINRRVSAQTGGKIPEIVERLSADTSLLALDALYFKDRWKTPFDRSQTRPEPFKRVDAKPITVSTMHLAQGHYLFRRDDRFVGIELPFADERFRMVIVTTQGDQAAPIQTFQATDDWLGGRGFMQAPGELALPHFDVSSREDVTAMLDARGLGAARAAPDALRGFTADRIRVSRVIQRLELHLNEEGVEVAAATAAIAERGIEGSYVHMVVDKPFVFALRDTTSGLILAAGYVGEPTALATAARP